MTCIHCDQLVDRPDAVHYPLSGATAHRACVSQPSFDEMDRLILATQLADQGPTRRVWSTGFGHGTETGRFARGPHRSTGPKP